MSKFFKHNETAQNESAKYNIGGTNSMKKSKIFAYRVLSLLIFCGVILPCVLGLPGIAAEARTAYKLVDKLIHVDDLPEGYSGVTYNTPIAIYGSYSSESSRTYSVSHPSGARENNYMVTVNAVIKKSVTYSEPPEIINLGDTVTLELSASVHGDAEIVNAYERGYSISVGVYFRTPSDSRAAFTARYGLVFAKADGDTSAIQLTSSEGKPATGSEVRTCTIPVDYEEPTFSIVVLIRDNGSGMYGDAYFEYKYELVKQ